VTPVDPANGTAESPIPVGRGPNGITTGAGAVWVTNSLDGTVSRINPGSLTVTTYSVGNDPQGVVVIGKEVWVAASGSAQSSVLMPRTVSPSPDSLPAQTRNNWRRAVLAWR
ncbi:MAG: hypothetical protein ACRDQZ_15285, partial [Mycobacteriales bacterium]